MTAILDIQTKDDLEPIKKPAKAWRNWCRAKEDCIPVDRTTGKLTQRRRKGDVFPGIYLYPSKEVAEQKAFDVIARDIRHGILPLEYLGAFPEGERPNG